MKFSRIALLSCLLATTINNNAIAGPDDDEIDLIYGGQPVRFTKSASDIAVRPDRATTSDIKSLLKLEEREGRITRTKRELGGFQVLKAKFDTSNEELDSLRGNSNVGVGTHVFNTSGDEVSFVPTGTIYVVFNKVELCDQDSFNDQATQLLEKLGLEIAEVRQPTKPDSIARKFLVRTTPSSPNPLKAARMLQQSDLVKLAEPEFATPAKRAVFQLPSDEFLRDQWHLRNTGVHRRTRLGLVRGADARVIEAWQEIESFGSSDITIAVIDDGFDLTHPDFARPGKVVSPWDFTRNSNNPSPADGDWHGTACAGVSLGIEGGGKIIGAAPGAKFMPLRWGPDLSDRQLEQWFGYAAGKNADVISCSWGAVAKNFPLSTRASAAIRNAATRGRNGKGSVILFAAGNENRDINTPLVGSVNGLAIHPNVIAVGASTSRDVRSTYSNFGAALSITAPSNEVRGSVGDSLGRERLGMGVLTADVRGFSSSGTFLGYSPTDYTYDFGGTSSATPLAAGIAGLVLSVQPELTSMQVKGVLEATARKIGGQTRFSPHYGYGCVNALEAVKLVKTTPLNQIDRVIAQQRR